MSAEEQSALLERLLVRAGQYSGRGLDHEGKVFLAELELTREAGGRAAAYRFRTQALEGNEVYHAESGLIGVGIDGRLALMASSSNYRHVFIRPLARVRDIEPPDGGGKRLVFAYGDRDREEEFRDEIGLALLDDGRLAHAYSWGLAGGPFALRASVVLDAVTSGDDERPVFIRHYRRLMEPDDSHYPGSDELMSIGAPIGRRLGLTRVGVHIETLPQGRRTSYPHAESTEEELVYVVSGFPEVWIDGEIYRLRPGDAVGLPAGTGIAHTFINNAPEPARLLVLGERRADNKIWYPLNPERRPQVGEDEWWEPAKTGLGPHDGLPDVRRKK